MTRLRIALAALACAALIAHLLFIPYAFAPLPLSAALARFAQAPWLQLGSDQNVALASRALMFLPLGVLLAMWIAPQPRRPIDFPAFAVASLLGCLWAIGVNFAQLWFPARTVILNIVAAEFIGAIGGALLWSTLGATSRIWWRQLGIGGSGSVKAALNGYVVLYLIASLTPFDFVTSAAELAEKATSDLYGIWLAPIGCGATSCGVKFAAVVAAALPCGWWFASRRRQSGNAWVAAVPVALGVATTIELLHFLMVSGVSQGASVVLRSSGMVLGAATYAWGQRLAHVDLDRIGRGAALALLAPYVAALAYVAGWFTTAKLGIAAGVARLGDIVWMPFYYEYFSPYQATMFSAMVHTVLYAPVAMLCWLWVRRRDRAPLWLAALVATLIASVVETSKVFLAGRLPDYTDVIYAAASATLALAVLRFASRSSSVSRTPRHGAPDMQRDASRPARAANPATDSVPGLAAATDSVPGSAAASVAARLAGLLLIVIAAVTVIGFPVASWALAAGLVVYAAVLTRYPTATYLIAIPMLLPVLDLAPLTGRFYWDEFDALLATTLGVRLLMALPAARPAGRLPRAALGLLVVSLVASTVIGVWPLAPIDANAFSSYLSPYNALRIVKGYAWAGALLWLIGRDASAGREVARPLATGLALSLLAATLSVFWERLQFAGWSAVGTDFRAAGFVSADHVGGAYLEAILVMLAPFGVAMAMSGRRLLHRAFWYVVVMAGAGAMLLTLSRTGFVAWLMSLAAFALTWALKCREVDGPTAVRRRRWGTGIAAVALVGLFVIPILGAQSSYLRDRLGASVGDFRAREAHWRDTVHMMLFDPLHVLLGMGLGSFPRDFYLSNAVAEQLPAYRLGRDPTSARRYLDLVGGRGMYMDQRVDVAPGREVLLRGEVRTPQTASALSISLCEKSLLNSAHCDRTGVSAGPAWRSFAVPLKSPPPVGARFGPRPPVALSLSNGAFGSRVEVTGLSLVDGHDELLGNGSFRHGLDRWFVTSDVHLAWRVLDTPLQVAFEQGALGILAWLALGIAAIGVALRSSAPAAMSAAFVAAMVGFLAVGSFDTLLDAPRIILLIALIGAVGWR
ncbi:MAG: O-antigen ligase family protein [Casimicrobiaceae bacterium]